MRVTYDFYSDPGHGWLKVSIYDLKALNLQPLDFSSYSYRRGDDLYLEEDCDASLFIKAWREANPGKQIKFRSRNANNYSRIRSYATRY